MDSRRFNKLVEKVRWVRNHRIMHDRICHENLEEKHVVSAIREKLSLSQEQLADLIGVLSEDVYQWEYGITDPECAEKIVLWIALNYPDVFLEAANTIKHQK